MKDILLYAYHVSVDNIKEYREYSVFEWNDQYYYFTKLKRSKEEFEDLLKVVEELLKKQVPVFNLIANVNNEFITMVGNDAYVLIEVNDDTHEYGILDMIERDKVVGLSDKKSVMYRNEWAKLWSEKVDYLEYQVHEMGKDYPVILNSFSYYVGLAENAICYVKHIEKLMDVPKKLPIVLSHRRVKYPNYRLNYDNPLNFIFDIEVRDIAEYLKSMALENKQFALIDLKSYIDLRQPDLYNMCMLYARLVYPSYYFDLHEKIINQDEKEDCLIPIIDQVDEMESFLRDAWFIMKNYVPIEPIAWLLKKEL